ncbi:hypothetical protein [Chryseobacterium gambrini]|uniref:hypothetical protein n=1 Tax=Chryseobacterium gambrini TaxID=373672 RepID=UPI0022F14A5A|nr:hypothetical protein [Chryseobacterium gambrini]WBV52077.1 hypothetical protein PFY09_17370 [Chryseobacterium gambrini]
MDIIAYFKSHDDYFWEWTTDEDIPDDTGYNENNLIVLSDLSAIAYRPYIIEILKELQAQGFPPFGALLLVLYVTNDSYINIDRLRGIIYHPLVREKVDAVLQFLTNINNLNSIYKKGQNKIILFQTIFNDAHNLISAASSQQILKEYYRQPNKIADCISNDNVYVPTLIKELQTLELLSNKFPTTESIIEAMKGFNDIPELEDEVVEEETTVETDKDFIQELIEEPKTFQVGSLIKRIWSGLKIPMRHLSPGEQPIGGISDMTNKGELHRMLLSEFANEDDIFMNRVANNEALFIQREIPPEENIFERIILIDTSMKNWGTPKVLAYASAIAVIKHPKAHSECKVFALGQNIIPMSLDKVDEVVENLNHVSPVLEVSGTLEKFFNEEHKEKDLEVFFITNQENLNHQNLHKIIHENRDRLKFLVTTSANGDLNFYKHHKGTRKHIQKIMLPLQELWANPPERRQRRENKFSGNGKKANVPFNYPILFPAPINKIATFLYEGEFFILSNKKQLLRTYLSDNYYNRNYYDTYKTHHGCEVLIDDISVKLKGQFALAKNKQGDFILCQYQPDKKLISKLNLNTKEYSELNLTGHTIQYWYKLVYFNKDFYLLEERNPNVYKINLEGTISIESKNDVYQAEKNSIKVYAELNKLNHSGLKILNNFHNIGINTEKKLVISNNELNKYSEDSITFYKNHYPLEICAEQNKNKFTFSDGSEIITDNRGILTFKSSNKNIPEFYIPSTEYGNLALATNTEFGGSEYYLPQNTLLKVRTMEEMYVEYMERFIDQIWEYGT